MVAVKNSMKRSQAFSPLSRMREGSDGTPVRSSAVPECGIRMRCSMGEVGKWLQTRSEHKGTYGIVSRVAGEWQLIEMVREQFRSDGK